MRAITLCMMLLGCSASSRTSGPTCKQAVEQLSRAVTTPADETTLMVGRCEQQAWTIDTRRCVASATSTSVATTCLALHEVAGTKPADPLPARELTLMEREQAAVMARDEAVKTAREAIEKVDRLAKDLDELNAKLTGAVNDVIAAQNDADRASAKAKLESLRHEQDEMTARIQAAKDAAAGAERRKGVHVSTECLNNPLAKGCS